MFRDDLYMIRARQRALRTWEHRFLAEHDADEIEAERQLRASVERATVDDLSWLDEYDPSRESAVIRDWHPEADA